MSLFVSVLSMVKDYHREKKEKNGSGRQENDKRVVWGDKPKNEW